MLNTLITAIARLLGVKAPSMEVSVQLTQTAGHAPQEHTTQLGNKPSARRTKSQSSPAQPRTQKKPKAVQSTKAVSKSTAKKSKPAPTGKSRKAPGNSTPTLASKTRQRAK